MFENEQLSKEREKLTKLDSLTVLDYIRTSIEILMCMKQEEGADSPKEKRHGFAARCENELEAARSDFSSTFQSIDFAPKEHEAQLQVYEAEVRNHIKVEQQLKLHIEILQEKIDDFEKERDKFKTILADQKQKLEQKIAQEFKKQLDTK